MLRRFTPGLGDGPAVHRLVTLLEEHERVDELRVEVNAGASGAMDALLNLLLRQGAISALNVEVVRRHGLTAAWSSDGTLP